MSTTSRGPSRRTLVKGAAWSVPVVAVAGAAPAMAASPTFEITGTTVGCKISRNDVYHLEITIENTGNQPNTISGVALTGQSSNGTIISWPAVPDQCMCPGDQWVLIVNSAEEDSIASFGAQITWDGVDVIPLNVPSNTPDCNSIGAPYRSYDTPSTATWLRISGSGCAGCP